MDATPLPPSSAPPWRSVPPTVIALIFLATPINVASSFYFIAVASYLLMVGVSAELVGLILGVSGVTMVLSAIPLGLLSDRKGRKVLLLFASIAFPPVLVVLALTTDPLPLILSGVLAGVAEAAFLSTWNALIADGTPPEARSKAFSMSFVVGTTTGGVGFVLPFFFPYLEQAFGVTTVDIHRFVLLGLAGFALVTPALFRLFAWGLPDTKRPRGARTRPARMGLLLRFTVVNGLIGFGAGFIIPLIPTWMYLRFGALDSFSGPLLALSNLTMGLAAVASPALSKRYGSVMAIVMTQATSTVFMVSLAFVPDLYLAAGLYVIRAALMNMGSPIMDTYLMGIIPKEDRGFASAINSIVWRLPNSVSTIAGGVLLGLGLYSWPFLIAGSLYICAVTAFYILFRGIVPTE